MKDIIFYLADKLVDFLLALVIVVASHYITKRLDRK